MRLALSALCLIVLSMLPAAADPLEFSQASEIPGFEAFYGEMDAVWQDGTLHAVTGTRGKDIIHARLVDGQWTAPVHLAHHRSGMSPSLAVCDGVLHMVANPGNFVLAHSIWDGRAWLEPVEIPDLRASRRASLAGFDGVLHLAHGGKNNDSKPIYYAAEAGWGWGHHVRLPDQRSRSNVAMSGLGETLHMVYVAKNSPTLWHTQRERWGEWAPPVQVPGVTTARIPDLVTAFGRLFAFFTTGDSRIGQQAPVAYSVFEDGLWQPPVAIEGYVCYGNPTAAVEPGLPQKIHVMMPTPQGVLHLHTEGEATIAPLPMKQVQLVR
jgi:hypothetical protein